MNADLKRLCEAAKSAFHDFDGGVENSDGDLVYSHVSEYQVEAIVRAVLTALGEPSKRMVSAGRVVDDDDVAGRFEAMIDHVLSSEA